MFERPETGERALLLHCHIGGSLAAADVDEFELLAKSAGADVVAKVHARLARAQARYLIGSGKVDEIAATIKEHNIQVVLIGSDLSPSQERNLERRFCCRVLDRSGLILDIFAQRARSFEGKLQVELAQLRHLSTRLVRGWTHLERQKGGIGLRGPGESQLETDRRLIGQRITRLRARLEKVDRQRNLGRQARIKRGVPIVALVGYTNAGKSTLFNALTVADVYAADQLFATLDPTLRQIDPSNGASIVLADTVGFVQNLPHELVAAFRSTLAETRDADLLLHVIDASDPLRHERQTAVDQVLAELGADKIPQILVYNKIDLTDRDAALDFDERGRASAAWVSAQSGSGIQALREAIQAQCGPERIRGRVTLGPADGRLRARLFELGAVTFEQETGDGGWDLALEMPRPAYESFCARERWAPDTIEVLSAAKSPAAIQNNLMEENNVVE